MTRKSLRVSDIVKQYEEKINPTDKKTTLVRDVFRNINSVDRFKKYRQSYMQKLEGAKYTTWHVSTEINDDTNMSSEYTNKCDATNSTAMMGNSQKGIENLELSSCTTGIILRSQINDASKNDASSQYEISTNTVSTSVNDIILSKDNSIESVNEVDDLGSNSSSIRHSGNDDVVAIRSEQRVQCINNNAPDKESERTSLDGVVSWIKESQFELPASPTPPSCQDFKNCDIYRESDVQNKTIKHLCVEVQEEDELKNFKHSNENVEIYREILQREVKLIDSIEKLDDGDDEETDTTTEYNVEEDRQDIPEIQYVNITDMYPEYSCKVNLLQYRNSRQLELAKSAESIAFNVDEVDIAAKDMFGKGSVTFKVRTSYWEVINPKHNAHAPEQFFNEVNFYTLIPIDIAKYINKQKYNNEDVVSISSKYHSQESLTVSCRERYDSYQSIGTLGSDDFLMQMSDHDSGTEDFQNNSSGLIRTDSKLVRVDKTYVNNTLRITKNIVLRDLKKEKPRSEHIVDELLKTELNNLYKLEYVRDKYMPALYNNDKYKHIIGKIPNIFLNWNSIYLRACTFYEQIEACGYDYEALADCVFNSVHMFEEYSSYCKEKAFFDSNLQGDVRKIMEEVQEMLGDKLGFSSYLLEPIQRLTKYTLLLQSLQKALHKTGDRCQKLSIAIDMIKQITLESNDCIDASYIKDFPYGLADQGKIIRKDTFTVVTARKKTKWTDMKIFLFEKVLIIAAPMKSSDGYLYRDHIFLDNMTFNSSSILLQQNKFIISDYNKNKQANDKNYKSFICSHKNVDVANDWKHLITNNLKMQFSKLRDEANSNTRRTRR